MRSFIWIILLLTTSSNVRAQGVFVNYDIDTSVYRVGEPLDLWVDFLTSGSDDAGSVFWNNAEVERFGSDDYFLVERELDFGTEDFLRFVAYASVKILSVREIGPYYKITSLMEFAPKNRRSQVQYTFHVYAGRANDKLKLFNALPINTELHLSTTTVGYIRYHYLKSHEFDSELAQKQSAFLSDFSSAFEVPIDTVDYYFAPTNEQINELRGFAFLIGASGKEIPSGKSEPEYRIVYSAGLDEYYPHELIHVLINPHYPNAHLWALEGLATYYGMSRGKDLDWHLKKVNAHLSDHPEIDLGNMLELRSLDQYTDYRYALGGFVMRKAYERGGVELIKQLLSAGSSDADYYSATEKYLGIERSALDAWIRRELTSEYGAHRE